MIQETISGKKDFSRLFRRFTFSVHNCDDDNYFDDDNYIDNDNYIDGDNSFDHDNFEMMFTII